MRRLTYFDGGKWRIKIGDTEYSGEAVDRLAAYEDTGLEPCDYSAMAHALEQAERAREDLTEMTARLGQRGLTASANWPRRTGRGGVWCFRASRLM
nr:MAG TPA: hypothetical protein [Caudoviricetes sp.]